jgi:hypothetical protein
MFRVEYDTLPFTEFYDVYFLECDLTLFEKDAFIR